MYRVHWVHKVLHWIWGTLVTLPTTRAFIRPLFLYQLLTPFLLHSLCRESKSGIDSLKRYVNIHINFTFWYRWWGRFQVSLHSNLSQLLLWVGFLYDGCNPKYCRETNGQMLLLNTWKSKMPTSVDLFNRLTPLGQLFLAWLFSSYGITGLRLAC